MELEQFHSFFTKKKRVVGTYSLEILLNYLSVLSTLIIAKKKLKIKIRYDIILEPLERR